MTEHQHTWDQVGSGLDARDDLLWIVAHWTQLRARLVGTGGNALTGLPGAVGSSSKVVIDVHVSDLMHEIAEKVARFYGRILMDETDWTPRTSHMPGLLDEVARRYGHFTTDDQMALGFCDDAHDYRERVRKVLERPAPPVYVGPCQHKGEDGAGCTGELYVREHKDAGTCRQCGTEFTLADQREWLSDELEKRLMTASEIVSALVVLDLRTPSGTVKSWIARERLREALPDTGLYHLADARELARRARRRVA